MDPQNKNRFNLNDLKKENPFQVPGNYFDSLGARIADKIEAQSPKKEPMFAFARIRPVLVYSGGIAAIAVFVYLGISVFSNKIQPVGQTNNELASTTEYAIVSELDEAELIELFTEETSVTKDSLYQENQERIIDYLVKEDIDISTIIEEL